MNITDLTPKQLHRAADIQEQIQSLQEELSGLLGGKAAAPARAGRKTRTISAAGRARIAAAQRARWARQSNRKPAARTAARKSTRRISAATRKRLAQLAKARWAKAKAAGNNKL